MKDCRGIIGYNSSSWRNWGSRNASGRLLSISYTKKRADTVLQASLYTTMSEPLNCSNWYLTFNNEHCTDPMRIYTSVVDRHPGGKLYAAPAVLTGYCYGTRSGRFRPGSTIEVSAETRACTPYFFHGRKSGVTGQPFLFAHVTTTFVVQEICP